MARSQEIRQGLRLTVRGLVQGVGFRPTIYRLARAEGLDGVVRNDGAGVTIEVFGDLSAISRFEDALLREPIPLARVDCVNREAISSCSVASGFEIGESSRGPVETGVVPDAATCPKCLAEVLDPSNRRYRYPFTNCTHCGPRLSIVRGIPYDRTRTSMSHFQMCAACRQEYEDPADRRFHAQPNACPECGPILWLADARGKRQAGDPIIAGATLLRSGGIVAVKGLGGFHLACDAADRHAVARLRERKQRKHKPFAVMVADLAMAAGLVGLDEEAKAALQSPAAPIVLLEPLEGGRLAEEIAPGSRYVGIMLPYTPLHHLLMGEAGRPLVMTSGNLSEEPQCIANDEALAKLSPIADAFLLHDREIVNRLDDSLVVHCAGEGSVLRRARGLAPRPWRLGDGFENAPPVLALGGELKSTFCLLRNGVATVSQHIGDLTHPETNGAFGSALSLYTSLFEIIPGVVAVDRHPDYMSSQWGEALATEFGARLIRIQHHHAHFAAVLAEHRVPVDAAPVLGVVLDGTGLGEDGTVWGAEFLLGGYAGFERVGHFEPIALPGGAAAVREPWRNTYAHVSAATGARGSEVAALPGLGWLADKPVGALEVMVERQLNAPLASSAGRVFDAVAGALGICRERQDYEAQAATELEALAAGRCELAAAYPIQMSGRDPLVLRYAAMWHALIDDLSRGVPIGKISARFHAFVVESVVEAVLELEKRLRFRSVALSGGVFQNSTLRVGITRSLLSRGLDVLVPREFPANDGGLALGQAACAAAMR